MSAKLTKASRALMRRSLRLLDMEYKPAEIADELATSSKYILRIVNAGAPARKDANGRYWIHGLSFARWLSDAAPKNDKELKARPTIADNEAYCTKCRAVTVYSEYRRMGRISYGECPSGHKVTRFVSITRKEKTNEHTQNARSRERSL